MGQGVQVGRSGGAPPCEDLTRTEGSSYGGPGTAQAAWLDPYENGNLLDAAVSPHWLPWRQEEEEGCVRTRVRRGVSRSATQVCLKDASSGWADLSNTLEGREGKS